MRRRVEIKLIEDKSKRHTTFTKRRQGLIKKTQDLAGKFDSEAAAIVFSKAGNVFAFGHPSVDSIVSRYLSESSSESAAGGVEEEERQTAGGMTVEETGKRIFQALESGGWNSAVDDLGMVELDELSAEIVRIRRLVAARGKEIVSGRETVIGGIDEEKS